MSQRASFPTPSDYYHQEVSEMDEGKADVRILLVGDDGVGKTSIVMGLLHDNFVENVPARCDRVVIPPDVSPEGVLTEIIDYSSREQTEDDLMLQIQNANVICIVYSVRDTETMNRVTSYWLPLIQKSLGGADHNRSLLLAANKSDKENETSHIEKMVPIMNDYLEIETVVECSARIMKNISEIFYYAQKAVVYPFRPLFSVEEKKLSMKCQKALARIFKICDVNNDGLLSDDELKNFQLISFGVPLTTAAVEEVKQVIMEYDQSMIIERALTLEGFLYLHQMFIQRGRHETVWTVLKRFGYDLNLQLRQDYLLPKIKISRGCSTEPSDTCLQFLGRLFKRFDEDCDDCLSTNELQSLFSVCPSNPWTEELLHSVELNSLGWVTYDGYINLWTLTFTLNLSQALELLAYLGYNVEHENQLSAITITRDRRIDVEEKSTQRKVFKCHIIGPKGAGKTVFCKSFIGKNIQDVAKMSRKQLSPYTINTAMVRVGSELKPKHLLFHEVDVLTHNELLSSQEKNADAVCLLYDSTNPNSFAYCAQVYVRYFYHIKIPCLIVATKADRYQVDQDYEYQPIDFCLMHQLPKPYYFRNSDIGNPLAEVFSQLATMATYPHWKKVYFATDKFPNLLASFGFVGVGVLAVFGLIMYKTTRGL